MQSEKISKRKILYLLIAFMTGIFMWFYVDEFGNNGGPVNREVTIRDIPISYIGIGELADRGLMLLEDQTSVTLDYLTVSGARRQVALLTRDDIRVTVNLSDVDTAGIRSVKLQTYFANSRFSEQMITKKSTEYATVNISELTSAKVPIQCELIGHVAEGYSAGQLQMSRQELEIQGQPEDIDAISYVKVLFDIGTDATETVSRNLTFLYFDRNDRVVSSAGIHPAVDTVKVTLPVYVTKELQLSVRFLESAGARVGNLDYDIQPRSIMVSGEASILNDISSVVLGEFDLLKLVSSKTISQSYPLILPDGCQNLSGVTHATMDVRFVDMTSTTVSTEQFAYKNLPDGKEVEILTKNLPVRIFGKSRDVAAVTGKQISVIANLSDYTNASGTYIVPASIQVNTPGDVGIAGQYQIQVTIREPAAETKPEDEATPAPEPPEDSQNTPSE